MPHRHSSDRDSQHRTPTAKRASDFSRALGFEAIGACTALGNDGQFSARPPYRRQPGMRSQSSHELAFNVDTNVARPFETIKSRRQKIGFSVDIFRTPG
ncbi:hypothetical protein ON010_g7866 [Phytophthora cinnamomi]|nr:hypothetical protein ON010_g7866 [Phytophthora cinnamomi]